MKKILIFSHAMELGGAERALLNLLYSFDYKKYQVDLFLMRHQGELMEYLPKEVNLLPEKEEYACMAVPISEVIKRKKIGVLCGRAWGKFRARSYVKKYNFQPDNGVGLEYSHKYTKRFMPNISGEEYDLAISFLTPHYFVSEKVIANKKIAWIHTDYSHIELDVISEEIMWNKYDYIVSISDACTKGFCSKFPELRDKIIHIDNIISSKLIKAQAENVDVTKEMPRDGSVRILSVGRFCNAKNFDNVPNICKRIRDKGLNVKWYLIGFGPDEQLIREKIQQEQIEEYVIILGKKVNPYPYMKECDIYIQPSRYEGNCVSVHEAQVLGKPVIITNYPTAKSQLHNGVDGMVVKQDNKGCALGIVDLLMSSIEIIKIKEYCNAVDFTNCSEIEKVYDLL